MNRKRYVIKAGGTRLVTGYKTDSPIYLATGQDGTTQDYVRFQTSIGLYGIPVADLENKDVLYPIEGGE